MIGLLSWLLPGGAVLILAMILSAGVGPDEIPAWAGGSILLGLSAAVALVSAYFHRSRLFLFALGLGAVHFLSRSELGDPQGILLLGGFLAFFMGFVTLFQDRGVLSPPALAELGALAAAMLLGWILWRVAPRDISGLLQIRLLPETWTEWTGLPQLVALAFAFALMVSFGTGWVRNSPVERGMFWAFLMMAAAFSFGGELGMDPAFFAGAVVTLGLSVMEMSYAMAYKDDLTGLPARRALVRDLDGMGSLYSAAMVDVDHFKRFNDRYGHDVGDQVLRMVASKLAKCPGGGRAYRYGGEEFALLFPGKSIPDCLPHLKTVRRSVEDATFILRSWRRPGKKPVDPGAWRSRGDQKPKRLSVTVSIGVADSTGKDTSPDRVLKRADRALYKAKRGGRNRVSK